ncbi:Ubiquitin carboxyl-terminal hydrolase 8 [Cyberlindnera fabianii]|uniref:Ubiquitin carboxyl-terminal hydrolase n=1 Tax=Cyberlindnera fabianii TaxID=36022 RepID=A0A1V2LC42_CYBFA|nr:Ubiquitin carboxyl-terminal hydrolase 8 [Cyberlindnera fabianii]
MSTTGRESPSTAATSTVPTPNLSASQFASLKPCSHLSQVLNSMAKDTVLNNYRLAVRVAALARMPNSEIPTYRSKNNPKNNVDKRSIIHIKRVALKCHGCIDGKTGHLFCFKCGDYTSDVQLDQVRSRIMNPLELSLGLSLTLKSEEEANLIAKYSRSTNFKPTTGLRGFVNMGATCFMSSVIQTFIHNPIIRDYFMTEGHMDCSKSKHECITCCLDEMFTDFYTSNKTSGFGPVNLLSAAWKANKSLAGYSEQDAHEFWQFMVNQLHKGLNKGQSSSSASSASSNSSHKSCSCILHKTFSSDLQSSITCTRCGNITNTIDPIIDISLEVSQSPDLLTCLKNFTKTENLDIKYSCSSCGERTEATKKLTFKKFPNTLAIQLKRFEHNAQSVKLENFIAFPMFMNMSEFSTDYEVTRKMDPSLSYELFAIVCHIGSVNTGHYVVVIKNNQGQWFKFDDSVVTLMSVEQVSQLKAYLLFYIVHKMI